MSSPSILAVSSLSNSTVQHARLDALDTSNVSRRDVTSQVDFGLYWNNDLVSGLDFSLLSSVVFAGNAIDIMLMHDHADNLSLFLDHVELLAIFTFCYRYS